MKRLLFFLLFLPLLGCPSRQVSEAPEASQAQDSLVFKKAKNIVLLIGDGMGLTQISAGMYSNGNKLNLEEFLYIGLHKPHAINDLVTDSAAGATAFASGIKTYNGAIGMSNERQPVKTILEDAEAKGMSTGLVVTSSITHATPAAFYAHQPDRRLMEAIAADLAKSDVDFFVGGGLKYFNRREDWRNLVEEMKAKNYFVSDFLTTEFKDIAIPFHQKFAYFTADTEPLSFSQGRDYLVQACQNAVTFLSSQPGE
ncbi:MAG: alkaline phosphatase, partial [Bacteroidota bacterium]